MPACFVLVVSFSPPVLFPAPWTRGGVCPQHADEDGGAVPFNESSGAGLKKGQCRGMSPGQTAWEVFFLPMTVCHLATAWVLVLKVKNTKYSILSGQVCPNPRFGSGSLDCVEVFKVKAVIGVSPPSPPTAVG